MNDFFHWITDYLILAGIGVAAILIILGIIFGTTALGDYISYSSARWNCEKVNGTLEYIGHEENWLFTNDIWNCKTVSSEIHVEQKCYVNGEPANCSEIINLKHQIIE